MRAVTLVGNDGTLVDLSQPPYTLAANPALWGMPPVATQTAVMLGAGGDRHLGAQFLPRPLRADVWVEEGSPVALDEAMAALARWVDPTVGPCRLIVDRGDGRPREVAVHYSSGFESISMRDRDRARAYVPLVFVAHDPYWQALHDVEYDILRQEFAGNEPTPWDGPQAWDAPRPWDGFNASGLQEFPVDLVGDVEAWPRWRFVGPASQVRVVNVTTGREWEFTGGVGTGRELVVDSRPGVRRVTLADVNAWDGVTEESTLWPLVPGRNWIGVRVQNWVGGQTQMLLSWRPRYLTC